MTKLEKELKELEEWFDVYYTRHDQKYRRFMTIGDLPTCARGRTLQLELYKEAEVKRARIQEIKRELEAKNAVDKK